MSYYHDDYDSSSDDFMYGDDYDPVEQMARDPVAFQMYGYGGFGYDTSHVRPDEARQELTERAEAGDVDSVRRLVEQAAAVSDEKKNTVLNYARRWTEVDYRASGFTKEYEWFDLTALATAAGRGHHDIVQYLLEQGADPTLKGCPSEDIHENALDAASRLLQKSKDAESRASKADGKGASASKIEEGVMLRCSQRCVDLLKAATPFWKNAAYSNSHYSKSREKFTNAPTDLDGLLEAVSAVPALEEVPPRTRKEGSNAKTKSKKQTGKKNALKDSKENNSNGKSKGKADAKENADGHQRMCSMCNASKPISSYSKNQRAKGAAAKCKDCVNNLIEAQQQPEKKAQKKTNEKDEELAAMIDDDIETIREETKYRLLEMQESAAAVYQLSNNVQTHSRASATLQDKVGRLVSASDRVQGAMAEMVKLIHEIENMALEEGVIPDF